MFSVVIPTYNRADKLKRALISLKSQSWQEFEVIVCDDGSTDDTKSVVASFEKDLDIKYIYSNNSGGPARPRNLGIHKAQYNWICFLDSDDWWYKDKLAEMRNAIQNFPLSDVYYHDFDVYSGSEDTSCGKFSSRDLGEKPYIELLVYGNGIVNSSAVVKKQNIFNIGGIDENENLISMEDHDLWIQLAKAGAKFTYIQKSLGGYWINDNDNITDNDLRGLICRETLYNKYINMLPPQDKKLFIQSYNLHLACVALDNKDFQKSLSITFYILRNPCSFRLFFRTLKFLKVFFKQYTATKQLNVA
jgi:glycosyltransferase involved in cell wall biosynthesis